MTAGMAWPVDRSVIQIVTDIENRRVLAEELMHLVLTRVRMTEKIFRAYSALDEDAAIDAARQVDGEVHARAPRKLLLGVPIGVKDNIDVAGLPTTVGSPGVHRAASADARSVTRLRNAGAVIVGKQQMHELGLGLDTPPTRNAWDRSRYPGGSTAGGAVSVALGSALAAIGTDTAGSIRKPAGLNGVVGLKPTYGRISRQGVRAPSTSLDHVGVIARSVEDCAVLLQVLAGHHGGDQTTYAVSVPDYLSAVRKPMRKVRLGVPRAWLSGVDAEILARFLDAINVFTGAGVEAVDVDINLNEQVAPTFAIINSVESYVQHASRLRANPESYSDEVRSALLLGAIIPASLVEQARGARSRIRDMFAAVYRRYDIDALITPTTPILPLSLSEMHPKRDLPVYSRFLVPFNLTGQPALSVPCGFSSDGLPVGMQLVGRPFDESTILRLGVEYESRTDWRRHPPSESLAAVAAAQTS